MRIIILTVLWQHSPERSHSVNENAAFLLYDDKNIVLFLHLLTLTKPQGLVERRCLWSDLAAANISSLAGLEMDRERDAAYCGWLLCSEALHQFWLLLLLSASNKQLLPN